MTRKIAKIKAKDDVSELTPASLEEIASNEDLLMEILLRVPAKSLIRFKCVSKPWLSMLSDPRFCGNHAARNPKVVSALYFLKSPYYKVSLHGHQSLPSLRFVDDVGKGDRAQVIHACNGLMLCSHGYRRPYSVSNLTTRKHTVVPQPDGTLSIGVLACLAFDPAKSPYYKVVLVRNPDCGSYPIYIYSSEKASWRRVNVPATSYGLPYMYSVFWDGAIHWLDYDDIHLQFEVDKEKLTQTLLPPRPKILSEEMIHYFGEFGGHLLLVQYRRLVVKGFQILEMKTGTSCWTVKHRVNLRSIIHEHPTNYEFHVLSVVKGSNESDLVLVLATPSKVLSYNLRCKTVEMICDFSQSEFKNLIYSRGTSEGYAHHFIESISPI